MQMAANISSRLKSLKTVKNVIRKSISALPPIPFDTCLPNRYIPYPKIIAKISETMRSISGVLPKSFDKA